MGAPELLYGFPDAEELDADPTDVLERWVDQHDDDPPGTLPPNIEEWDVHPPEYHMPAAETILEWITEVSAENEVDEGWWEQCQNACGHPDVIAAANALRTALGARITCRMARTRLRELAVTRDEHDGWLIAGQPAWSDAVASIEP